VYIYDSILVNSPKNEKFSDRSCRENQNTRFMFSNFFSASPVVYEIMWKNMA